jgi:5-formyltetrahydrofolate cyclo-ligase
MTDLSPECQRFWNTYLLTLEHPPAHPKIQTSIPGNIQLADELLGLYLSGKKRAGSGLVRDYEMAGEPLPAVGDYWIVLDSRQKPQCLLQTIRVEIHRFDQVPESVAAAEGEGDGSLRYWRDAHAKFFAPYLDPLGIINLNSTEVVTEYFTLVFRANHGS